MPRPKFKSDYKNKVEKQTNLPISYYNRDKTERMIDLPSFYYGKNLPELETNNLIYQLDGVGSNIVKNNWYNSVDKAKVSKAVPVNFVGLIDPIQEDKSFRFINSTTRTLDTNLSSDYFNNNSSSFTLSFYFKISSGNTAYRLLQITSDNLGNSAWALFIYGNSLRFRSPTPVSNRIDIVKDVKYMATITRTGTRFRYYLNDKYFYSDSVALTTPTPPSTNVIIGGTQTTSLNAANCNVYGFLAYTSELNLQQIANNYRYLKQRYGV